MESGTVGNGCTNTKGIRFLGLNEVRLWDPYYFSMLVAWYMINNIQLTFSQIIICENVICIIFIIYHATSIDK